MPVKYRIHPAIGVARIGDSPDDFFIGPEAPGIAPTLNKPDGSSTQPGKYKDSQRRIKRQGARFRIYEYTEDAAGAVTRVREITAAEATIEWEVHLANRKAAANLFKGGGRRNAGKPESDLVVDAGPQRISGPNQPMKKLAGKFMRTTDIELGALLTDVAGRLIVLGGHGKSQSPEGRPLSDKDEDFADNDGWCDDVADGPVRATVRIGSAAPVVADPAWLIVAPPDFAPVKWRLKSQESSVICGVALSCASQFGVHEAPTTAYVGSLHRARRRVNDYSAQSCPRRPMLPTAAKSRYDNWSVRPKASSSRCSGPRT